MGSPSLFTRQRGVKMGYFYWLRVKNNLDDFSVQRDISHRVSLSLIVYSSTSQKKCIQLPCIFYPLKETQSGHEVLGPLYLSL